MLGRMKLSIIAILVASHMACAAQLKIACVGDSITYGYRGWVAPKSPNAFPSLLRSMLDAQVFNLGVSGSTMGNVTDNPYWATLPFDVLMQGRWDVVIIMVCTA